MGVIATENDARTIGGSSASYTSNLCATKSRAIALNCTVSGNYDNNLLVLLSDIGSHRNYFKLTTTSSGTFTFTGNNLDYSTNGGASWTTLQSGSATPSFSSGTEVVWRFTKSNDYSPVGTFSSTCSFTVSGNVLSLLYGDNFENQTTAMNSGFNELFYNCVGLTSALNLQLTATTLEGSCYYKMFRGCSSLTSAPALPATTMSSFCYHSMFRDCTSLTAVPSLPATNLDYACYLGMFYGCTSIRSVTSNLLPATTLARDCYTEMFKGCTALISAPSLPATTLADYCYEEMFSGCISLATAPSLPATTLANSCYLGMFYGCSALTSTPTMSATTLAYACYRWMFQNCTSLISTVSLPVTNLESNCYYSMFLGCTSLTTAPNLPALTLVTSCYAFMFKECTSLYSAPTISATTLASSCCSNMFEGCTSLTTAPTLSAATLQYSCYYRMFFGCSSLNSINCYAADISASNCTNSWLYGVANRGTFIQARGASWSRGVDGIPSTWMVMEPLPELGTCTIENYGIFLSDFGYNSNILSVTFLYLISIVATPDIDAVAQSERYRPTLIALYKAGKSYPLTWSSLEGAYALKPYSSITIDAPWVEDGYNTDIHIVIGTNAGLTGSLCYLNNGLTLTFDNTVIPYLASYFKMNGVYPVILNEECPCCLSSSGNGNLCTYIPY